MIEVDFFLEVLLRHFKSNSTLFLEFLENLFKYKQWKYMKREQSYKNVANKQPKCLKILPNIAKYSYEFWKLEVPNFDIIEGEKK